MDLIYFNFPGLANVSCAFTGRSAGLGLAGNLSFNADESSALESRSRLLAALRPAGLEEVAECRQAHGDKILREPAPLPFLAPALSCQIADGMMTCRRGLGLMIKTADCQPVLIAAKSGACVMALHVGWRGNRINFPATAIRAFCNQYGLKPEQLVAVRGPSLGHAEFVNFAAEWGAEFEAWHNAGQQAVDLWQLTRHQLEACGLAPEAIYEIDICTAANHQEFFSYRKDKTAGRQAGLIWIQA